MYQSVHRRVDARGPVHVTDYGGSFDGVPVLCVHGLRGQSAVWAEVAHAVGRRRRVLTVDLPGHGRSPAAGRPLGVRENAGVLVAVIEQLGLGPVTLVGHSMGAVVCALAAVASPELVERLVLVAPPLPGRGLEVVTRSVLPDVVGCLCPTLATPLLRRRMRAGEVPVRPSTEAGDDPVVTFVEAARSVGVFVALGGGYPRVLAGVRAPTTVVHGSADPVVSPRRLRQLRRLRSDWSILLLDDVGHCPQVEAPAAVADLLIGAPGRPATALAEAGRP